MIQEHGWDLSRALNSFFTAKCEQAGADMAAKAEAKPDLPKKSVAEGARLEVDSVQLFFSSSGGTLVHQSP